MAITAGNWAIYTTSFRDSKLGKKDTWQALENDFTTWRWSVQQYVEKKYNFQASRRNIFTQGINGTDILPMHMCRLNFCENNATKSERWAKHGSFVGVFIWGLIFYFIVDSQWPQCKDFEHSALWNVQRDDIAINANRKQNCIFSLSFGGWY